MEEERYPTSRGNPRSSSNFLSRDRPRQPAPAESEAPPARPSLPIVDRFRAMLREREEELRETGEEYPPPPTVGEIVRLYKEVLAELTFNSKPVITELTVIAGQHIQFAEGIADAICSRILEVPVDQKLPSLYLLDSIVKNIGREYVRCFAVRIPKVFCEVHRQVHPSQHPAMRHLFGTWSQVFPSSVLCKIQDELHFSPAEKQRPMGNTNPRSSESLSPHPSHGIHVNPKYLEAQRQLGDSTVDVNHCRGVSPSIQAYGQKSAMQQGEFDFDDTELLPPCIGMAKANSLQPHLKAKVPIPLSPPSIGLRRSRSPTGEGLPKGVSRRAMERPSPSHPGFGYEPAGLTSQNDWFERSWTSDDGGQLSDSSRAFNLNNGYSKQYSRELIDTYGNHRGKDTFLENRSKVQRLETDGIASGTTRKWENSEEEDYDWEAMSPTLADRSRRNSMPAFGLSAGPFSSRAGLTTPHARFDSDFGRRSWPCQGQLPDIADSFFTSEQRMSAIGFGSGSLKRNYPEHTGTQNEVFPYYHSSLDAQESGRLCYMLPLPEPLQQNLSPQSRGQASQMPFTVNRIMPSTERASSPTPAPVERTSFPEIRAQQFPPIPPSSRQFRSRVDLIEANKPLVNQGLHQSLFLHQQQYDSVDRTTSDISNLVGLPYRQAGLAHLNQKNQEQTEAHRIITATAQIASHLVPQSVNHLQAIGHSVGMTSGLPSSFVPLQSIPNNLLHLHDGVLPPLPLGSPPASSQIGSTSQYAVSVASSSTSGVFSGLLGTLMAQGLISLAPADQSQDSVRVEFNVELIKVRHEHAINALYIDLPRQCTSCGLRFKCQEDHSRHMDWHVTKNRISKNCKQKPSRKWFVSAKEWFSGAETLGNDVPGFLLTETVTEKKEDKDLAVPADENQNVCALCGESFEDFYSDETEEWMYKGAVYINAPDGNFEDLDRSRLGPIVHAKCRSESTQAPAQA
ncbi:polyadenylation and cleavage factor homolog 4-like isoform X2 [Typha angustifolia]|uniref:polyadenylation and cleavage factor homolog 4-like isoform X2 n=1 Tax=Typha angustifolia TaxID=59011 RepID=UPI003C2D5497